MIGVVTHTYPNGDFDVWFREEGFGATCFRQSAEVSGEFEAGDRIDCVFADAGRGTVVRAVLTSTPRRVTVEAPAPTATRPTQRTVLDGSHPMERVIEPLRDERSAYFK